MRTSFRHQSEAQHPKSSAIHKYAGRLPHLMTQSGHSDDDSFRSGSVPQGLSPRLRFRRESELAQHSLTKRSHRPLSNGNASLRALPIWSTRASRSMRRARCNRFHRLWTDSEDKPGLLRARLLDVSLGVARLDNAGGIMLRLPTIASTRSH
jgi:hypothetical protein